METIEDIVKQIRKCANLQNADPPRLVFKLADRIEAAHRRQMDQHEDDLVGIMSIMQTLNQSINNLTEFISQRAAAKYTGNQNFRVRCPKHGITCGIKYCSHFLSNAAVVTRPDGTQIANGFCKELGNIFIANVPQQYIEK